MSWRDVVLHRLMTSWQGHTLPSRFDRDVKCIYLNEIHIFQCMDKICWVFHTKIFMQRWNLRALRSKSSDAFLKRLHWRQDFLNSQSTPHHRQAGRAVYQLGIVWRNVTSVKITLRLHSAFITPPTHYIPGALIISLVSAELGNFIVSCRSCPPPTPSI